MSDNLVTRTPGKAVWASMQVAEAPCLPHFRGGPILRTETLSLLPAHLLLLS